MDIDKNNHLYKLGFLLLEYEKYIINKTDNNCKKDLEFQIDQEIKYLIKYFSYDLLSGTTTSNTNRTKIYKLARKLYLEQKNNKLI